MKDLKQRKKQLIKNINDLHKNIKKLPSRRRELALTKLRSRLAEVNYLMK
jgi:prefoldin subunit 5